MSVITDAPMGDIADDEKACEAFFEQIAKELGGGWSLAVENERYPQSSSHFVHPTLGKIQPYVELWGAGKGEKMTFSWSYEAENTVPGVRPASAAHACIGASASTGAKKIAANIHRRLLSGIEHEVELVNEKAREDEREARAYAAQTDRVATILGDVVTSTSGSYATVKNDPRDNGYGYTVYGKFTGVPTMTTQEKKGAGKVQVSLGAQHGLDGKSPMTRETLRADVALENVDMDLLERIMEVVAQHG